MSRLKNSYWVGRLTNGYCYAVLCGPAVSIADDYRYIITVRVGPVRLDAEHNPGLKDLGKKLQRGNLERGVSDRYHIRRNYLVIPENHFCLDPVPSRRFFCRKSTILRWTVGEIDIEVCPDLSQQALRRGEFDARIMALGLLL